MVVVCEEPPVEAAREITVVTSSVPDGSVKLTLRRAMMEDGSVSDSDNSTGRLNRPNKVLRLNLAVESVAEKCSH